MMPKFPCTACGQCCRHVHLSELTRDLDRGDGICAHFDDSTNLCSIYESRPDVCRVDVMYRQHFQEYVSWSVFVAENMKACAELQAMQLISNGEY